MEVSSNLHLISLASIRLFLFLRDCKKRTISPFFLELFLRVFYSAYFIIVFRLHMKPIEILTKNIFKLSMIVEDNETISYQLLII